MVGELPPIKSVKSLRSKLSPRITSDADFQLETSSIEFMNDLLKNNIRSAAAVDLS